LPSIALSLRTILAGLFVLAAAGAAAAASPCDPQSTEEATLAEINDHGDLGLVDGRVLRLAGILVSESAPALMRSRLGPPRELRFQALSKEPDRWGRINAQVLFPGEAQGNAGQAVASTRSDRTVDLGDEAPYTLQQWLVDLGEARVAPGLSSPEPPSPCLRFLLGREELARGAKRGLWRDTATEIRSADDPDAILDDLGHFAVVEGTVASVGDRKRMIYLNFGTEWTRDFTVTILKNSRTRLVRAGLDLAGLKGKRVRVRGLVEANRGPFIEAVAPEQIEVVGAE
jgi:hypothetical protein